MKYTPTLARLIDSLRCLPGVGPKSAQRMAFHLLERDRDGGRVLAHALAEALENVGHCKRCRMLTESELCAICASPQRDVAQLCVVESPADVVAIEQSGGFRGRGLKVSRIAHGVPVGGELEYVDGGTLAHALAGRTAVS